jgi:hypothetical protein
MIHAVSEQRGVHRVMEQLFGKEVLYHVVSAISLVSSTLSAFGPNMISILEAFTFSLFCFELHLPTICNPISTYSFMISGRKNT